MNYKSRHKSMSCYLTMDEYTRWCELAQKTGFLPSQFVRELVRRELAKQLEPAE